MAGERLEAERKAVTSRASEFSRYGPKFEKAVDTVASGGVKECLFLPSGRRVVSVVGTLGDELIDPSRPYCSCGNFFFRVSHGGEETCYHLLSFMIAAKTGRVDILEFSDEEFGDYLSAVVRDVLEVFAKTG